MKMRRRLAVLLIAIFILTFGTGIIIGKNLMKEETIEEKVSKGKPINVLVMGIDARSREENSRSDTMILVSVDRNTKKIAMVWIPRDTRVEVGFNRYDKINSINYLKGPEAACEAVGKLLNTRVNYYVVVNFAGFVNIIDLLGGVHIDVETDMKHYDPDPKLNINLSKGPQVLNGEDALRYVRYRGGPTADIGRTQRQQKFIKALANEMLDPKNIVKLPKLIPEVLENVKTNIPAKDVLLMVDLARDFDAGSIITQTLPGYSFTDPKTGASYWEADREIAKRILEDLFAGKTYEVAKDPPNWVKPAPAIYTPPAEEETEEPENTEESENSEDALEGSSGDITEENNLETEDGIEITEKELTTPEPENETLTPEEPQADSEPDVTPAETSVE